MRIFLCANNRFLMVETCIKKKLDVIVVVRLVKLSGKAPKNITENEMKFPIGICTCGLSKNFPFCDGAHKRTEDEESGVIYIYDENTRVKVQM